MLSLLDINLQIPSREACAKSIYDAGVETEPGAAFYDG